jgi:hypothetical protein
LPENEFTLAPRAAEARHNPYRGLLFWSGLASPTLVVAYYHSNYSPDE